MDVYVVLPILAGLCVLVFLVVRFFDPGHVVERLREAFVNERHGPLSTIVGACGTVVNDVSQTRGQVDLEGELWEARIEADDVIQKGKWIRVDRIVSTVVIVSRTGEG